jgi:hypothetical protein
MKKKTCSHHIFFLESFLLFFWLEELPPIDFGRIEHLHHWFRSGASPRYSHGRLIWKRTTNLISNCFWNSPLGSKKRKSKCFSSPIFWITSEENHGRIIDLGLRMSMGFVQRIYSRISTVNMEPMRRHSTRVRWSRETRGGVNTLCWTRLIIYYINRFMNRN